MCPVIFSETVNNSKMLIEVILDIIVWRPSQWKIA